MGCPRPAEQSAPRTGGALGRALPPSGPQGTITPVENQMFVCPSEPLAIHPSIPIGPPSSVCLSIHPHLPHPCMHPSSPIHPSIPYTPLSNCLPPSIPVVFNLSGLEFWIQGSPPLDLRPLHNFWECSDTQFQKLTCITVPTSLKRG